MTNTELIDALAASHRLQRWKIAVEPWDELTDDVKEIWRQEQRDLWPITAMFVLEWLSDRAGDSPNACGHLAAEWANTMMGDE